MSEPDIFNHRQTYHLVERWGILWRVVFDPAEGPENDGQHCGCGTFWTRWGAQKYADRLDDAYILGWYQGKKEGWADAGRCYV